MTTTQTTDPAAITRSFTMQVRFVIDPETGRTTVYTDDSRMGEYFDASDASEALGKEFQLRIDRADSAAVVFIRSRRDPCISHSWEWVLGDDTGDTYDCALCDALGFLPAPGIVVA